MVAFLPRLTLLAGLLSMASAQDTGKQSTSINLFTPANVKAGSPVTITWSCGASYTGTALRLVLLRGPSTNIIDCHEIAASVPNTGSYTWNVPEDLEGDVTHYGIRIEDVDTKEFQWSSQFGVDGPSGPGLLCAADGSSPSVTSKPGVASPTGHKMLTVYPTGCSNSTEPQNDGYHHAGAAFPTGYYGGSHAGADTKGPGPATNFTGSASALRVPGLFAVAGAAAAYFAYR